MAGESGVTRSIIVALHFWDIQGDQTADESCVAQSIIDNLTIGISKEMKWKVKVVLLEVSI